MCNSGCRSSIAGTRPSSAVQLPITATLYAEYLTLFRAIIHHMAANVNSKKYQFPGAAEILRESGASGAFRFSVAAERKIILFIFKQMCYHIR